MRRLPQQDPGQDLPPPSDWRGRPGALQEVRPKGLLEDRGDYERSVIVPRQKRCVPFHEVRKGDLIRVHHKSAGPMYDDVFLVLADPVIGRVVSWLSVISTTKTASMDMEFTDRNVEVEVIA